jgi:hypothetical protein
LSATFLWKFDRGKGGPRVVELDENTKINIRREGETIQQIIVELDEREIKVHK